MSTTNQPKLLIINADDFGLNEAANAGIIESYQAGSVTSTTLMANAPFAGQAAGLARENPGLGVGLHFNLTWGRPLMGSSKVPALVGPDGAFLDRSLLARRLLMGRIPARQVEMELGAQLQRMQELGVQPTHMDSHQHVHGFGVVFSAVAKRCVDLEIPMRVPWVATTVGGGMSRRLRRYMLATLLARATRRWKGRVRWNDGLGSVFDLGADGRKLGDEDYRRILSGAREGAFELMVHPVTDACAMEGYTRIGLVGEAEWRYLRTGTLAGLAHTEGFRLGSYRDLMA